MSSAVHDIACLLPAKPSFDHYFATLMLRLTLHLFVSSQAVHLAVFLYQLVEVCHLEHKPQFNLICVLPHFAHTCCRHVMAKCCTAAGPCRRIMASL